ncbi:hypothetical protein [Staphylococcus pettenkoferi]|uniref:Uncharacterized protein n=1 Tax=Staphylococcus pettenkoferi TaxID=170573 RepID=A0A9Q4GZQ1_9STAP|nr:hypothetical protein [Staphylococcus pettenkoferi]MCY1569958.1 hypothetical protein [Staphylococcus pettenkoferi]MCY1576268.1 hypothetical protein [Staphylococcus pettenkoferi]MCY1594054.1 hypothetical protein [Staphylococcus pettenkoferi]MCY1616844.1 hypothetical protein [Staphylococcus pettenkoferi]
MNQTIRELRKSIFDTYRQSTNGVTTQNEYLKSLGDQILLSQAAALKQAKPELIRFNLPKSQFENKSTNYNYITMISKINFNSAVTLNKTFSNLAKVDTNLISPAIKSQIDSIMKIKQINLNLVDSIRSINNQYIRSMNKNFSSLSDAYIGKTKEQLISYIQDLKYENENLSAENERFKEEMKTLKENDTDKAFIDELINKILDIYNIISQTLLKTTVNNIGSEIYNHGITQVKLDSWVMLMLTIISVSLVRKK